MASVQINPNLVPPAALVTFVQKGLQYMEAEANIDPVSHTLALWLPQAVSCPCCSQAVLLHQKQCACVSRGETAVWREGLLSQYISRPCFTSTACDGEVSCSHACLLRLSGLTCY